LEQPYLAYIYKNPGADAFSLLEREFSLHSKAGILVDIVSDKVLLFDSSRPPAGKYQSLMS
jgi:hypothetical protein